MNSLCFRFLTLTYLIAPSMAFAVETCDVLPEAIICEADFPWKKVASFPFGNIAEKPIGIASMFHLDGRGMGVVRSIDRNIPPYFDSIDALADYWTRNFFDSMELSPIGDWKTSLGMIDGQVSANRKILLDQSGRTIVLRSSFVGGESGDLMIYSILNKKISSQAGWFLHQGLLSAVKLTN